MGNSDGGATVGGRAEGILDLDFRRRVERGCRFVEESVNCPSVSLCTEEEEIQRMGGGLTGSLACGEGLWQWLGAVAVHLIHDCLACRPGC